MGWGIGLAIASGLMKANANKKAAQAQAEAYARTAQAKEESIQKMIKRNEVNNMLLNRKANQLMGMQAAQASASGVELTGSTLLEMTATLEDAGQQEIINNLELEQEIGAIRAEINLNRALEKDAKKAGKYGLVSDFLDLGSKMYTAAYSERGTGKSPFKTKQANPSKQSNSLIDDYFGTFNQ